MTAVTFICVQHFAHFYSTWIFRVNEMNSGGEEKMQQNKIWKLKHTHTQQHTPKMHRCAAQISVAIQQNQNEI